MKTNHTGRRLLGAALLSAGISLAGVGLAAGAAQAQGPTDNFSVPHQWCPGQNLPMSDVVWDMNVCHTWFWVPVGGMGNVGQFVWDGDTPPPHGPPPCYGAPICLPGL